MSGSSGSVARRLAELVNAAADSSRTSRRNLRALGGDRTHAAWLRDQQHVGRTAGKDAVGHDAGDVVQLHFHGRRIEQRQAVAIEDQIAVVGLVVLAQHRVRAAPKHLAADVAARHGNHLDRQRKPAQHADQLARVADADELLRHGGDDLLARQRAAATLDHVQVLGHFIGAIDVHAQVVDGVQVEYPDAMLLEARRARLGGRDGPLDAAFHRGEGVDEQVDRRARPDADHALLRVLQRDLRDGSFLLVLAHQRLRCGGRSVQTPWNASAAMPTDSAVVGCGWMVLPISVASEPISTARAISLMRSPAPRPTMPPPRTRWLSASKMSLVKPSSRALAMARPEAAHGNLATPTFVPAFFASSSVSPTQAISGSVYAPEGMTRASK